LEHEAPFFTTVTVTFSFEAGDKVGVERYLYIEHQPGELAEPGLAVR
jgi:hypothetical protein